MRLCILVGLSFMVWACLCEGSESMPQLTEEDGKVELSGEWQSTENDQSLLLNREQLAKLGGYTQITRKLLPHGEAVPLGVLPLESLIEAYPLTNHGDAIVLETLNRWESFLTVDYIRANGTLLLLLYYDGMSSETGMWPSFGGDIEPLAPYYVFNPDIPIPTFPASPTYGMINATQIKGIRAVNTNQIYAAFFPESSLSEGAQAGRKLFLQRCNNCHQGPGGNGGNVSQRPFVILQIHARFNTDYLKQMIVNPKQFYPETHMPKHEDLSDDQLEALVAFLAEVPANVP